MSNVDAFSTKTEHLHEDYRKRCEGLLSDDWRLWVSDKQVRAAIAAVIANGQTKPSYLGWNGVPDALGVWSRDWHKYCALGDWLRGRAIEVTRAIKEAGLCDE